MGKQKNSQLNNKMGLDKILQDNCSMGKNIDKETLISTEFLKNDI